MQGKKNLGDVPEDVLLRVGESMAMRCSEILTTVTNQTGIPTAATALFAVMRKISARYSHIRKNGHIKEQASWYSPETKDPGALQI
jgi:hypothetical protein